MIPDLSAAAYFSSENRCYLHSQLRLLARKELDKEINVAIGARFGACNGAEQRKPLDA